MRKNYLKYYNGLMTIRGLLFIVWLLLLLFAVLTFSATTQAAEYYLVTEQELTQLETNSKQLKNRNYSLENSLTQAQSKITNLENRLTISNKELQIAKQRQTELETTLQNLKTLSENKINTLQVANKSLDAYAKEEKRKYQIAKLQRNFYEGTTCALVSYGIYHYITKHT